MAQESPEHQAALCLPHTIHYDSSQCFMSFLSVFMSVGTVSPNRYFHFLLSFFLLSLLLPTVQGHCHQGLCVGMFFKNVKSYENLMIMADKIYILTNCSLEQVEKFEHR